MGVLICHITHKFEIKITNNFTLTLMECEKYKIYTLFFDDKKCIRFCANF